MVTALPPLTKKLHFRDKDSAFRQELLRRVEAHFELQGRSRHATPFMWAKAVFWLGGLFGLIALLSFTTLPGWASLPLAVVLGAFLAGVGFNVGHDAVHGAFTGNARVDAALGKSFDLVGASSWMWAWAHNVIHHTYTNVVGVDHDLEPGFYLRLYPKDRPAFLHRFQHRYFWVLYAFTSAVWVFKKDYAQLLSADARKAGRTGVKATVDVVLGKALHFAAFLGVPLLAGQHAWWQVLVGYVVALAVSGLIVAIVFQLAHVVDGPGFPKASPDGALDDDFFVHQLKTTANFSVGNTVMTFLVGGLNHQVEHHLFPKVCHVHYPELAPIVKACAKAFGVPYLESPTFLAALQAHVRWLKLCGRATEAEVRELVPHFAALSTR